MLFCEQDLFFNCGKKGQQHFAVKQTEENTFGTRLLYGYEVIFLLMSEITFLDFEWPYDTNAKIYV